MIRSTPQTWNPTVYCGKTFYQRFTVANGTAVADLSAVVFSGSARTAYTSGTALVTFGTADGSIVNGGTAGWVDFELSSATTTALGTALAYAEAQLILDVEAVESGDTSPIFLGIMSVKPDGNR